jgi:hypothetical protein
MVFKYKSWTLYKGLVKLKNGTTKINYFFSKWPPKKCKPCDLPKGYTVAFDERIGLPYLKKLQEFPNQHTG